MKYWLKRNDEVILRVLYREVMGMVEEEEERRRTRRKDVEQGAGEARRKDQGSGKQGVERKQKSQGQKPMLRKVSVHQEEELLGQGPLMITKVRRNSKYNLQSRVALLQTLLRCSLLSVSAFSSPHPPYLCLTTSRKIRSLFDKR